MTDDDHDEADGVDEDGDEDDGFDHALAEIPRPVIGEHDLFYCRACGFVEEVSGGRIDPGDQLVPFLCCKCEICDQPRALVGLA